MADKLQRNFVGLILQRDTCIKKFQLDSHFPIHLNYSPFKDALLEI
jgi:hypothetical protein